jgi:GNAT superfamily N-acetyltransferase
MKIKLADTDQAIQRCYPVMAELRPQFSAEQFLAQVRRQMGDGYRLAYLEIADRVASVAGFRLGENLAWGRHLYVDDLVTAAAQRSAGHGQQLLAWLVAYAREHGCQQLHLDSGVQRFAAHKFYLREGMIISGHHFTMAVEPIPQPVP